MEKYYYSYDEFLNDIKKLVELSSNYGADTILAVARGGMTIGHFMGTMLENRRVFTLNSIHYDDTKKLDTLEIFNIPDLSDAKKVLIVDDIIDSGETMKEILFLLHQKYPKVKFKIATIFYKTTAMMKPDFYLKEAKYWIDFFWDVDTKD